MSVVFYLQGGPLSVAAWNGLISNWADTALPYEDPTLRRQGEEFIARLWEPGSIRGVLLVVDPDETQCNAQVQLKAFSSRKDWAIAFALLRAVRERAGAEVIREDGKVYGDEDLTEERADADAVYHFCATAKAAAEQGERRLRLPIGPFRVPIECARFESCTPETMPEFESELAGIVERCAGAEPPRVFRSDRGTVVARWDLGPAVLPRVEEIACPGKGPEYAATGEWVAVPFEHALDVLGDLAEDLGDYVFVPELLAERDREVLEALVEPGRPVAFEASDEEAAEDAAAPEAPGHKRRLPLGSAFDFVVDQEGAEDAEDAIGELLQPIARILSTIATVVLHGDPENVILPTVRELLPERLADSFIEMVTIASQKLIVEREAPAQVVRDLMVKGIPRPIAQLAVGAILEASEAAAE